MVKAEKGQFVQTHKELMQLVDNESNVSGFSVLSNLSVKREHFITEHFRSDYIIICMVTAGSVTLNVNFKRYCCPVNGFVIMPPNALRQFVEASEDATVSMISFTSDFFGRIGVSNLKLDLFEYFSTKFFPFWQLDDVAANMILTLMHELERRNLRVNTHPFGTELLYTLFQVFLYEIAGLSTVYAGPASTYLSRKEKLVMEFVLLIQKHFKIHKSVAAYANMLNLTAKYLTETVKEITGRNAGDMIGDIIMHEAKFLLNDPEYSVAQAADRLNFIDQSSFGKFFKRKEGVSPKAYRDSLEHDRF